MLNVLPAVRVSPGCVAESEESVVNERQQQAPLPTVKTTTHVIRQISISGELHHT